MLFSDTLKGALECLLFATNKPLSVQELASIISIKEDEVVSLLSMLKNEYKEASRGLKIVKIAGGYKMATKKTYASYLKKLYKPKTGNLTKPAMETLAIIAYRQPITRAEIEAIRGVKVERMLSNLIEKGLVREVGRKETPGRPILYGTTWEFLQYLGLYSLNDLPPLN